MPLVRMSDSLLDVREPYSLTVPLTDVTPPTPPPASTDSTMATAAPATALFPLPPLSSPMGLGMPSMVRTISRSFPRATVRRVHVSIAQTGVVVERGQATPCKYAMLSPDRVNLSGEGPGRDKNVAVDLRVAQRRRPKGWQAVQGPGRERNKAAKATRPGLVAGWVNPTVLLQRGDGCEVIGSDGAWLKTSVPV